MKIVRLAALLFTLSLYAQPAFEVASLKPRDIFKSDGRKFGLSISGNNVSFIGYTLHELIMEAYSVESYQVSGGPGWTDDAVNGIYAIDAKTEGETAPSKDQVRKMLQTLLADRFQLQFHHEQKDLPVYELVVAKRGPKLTESAADGKFSNHQSSSGQAIRMTAVHETMDQFVHQIGVYTGRPVIDNTGLAKFYDFVFEFTSEGPKGHAATDAPDPSAPSIFTAIEQQLGLKLEPQKKPVDMIVIDRAEKPSSN